MRCVNCEAWQDVHDLCEDCGPKKTWSAPANNGQICPTCGSLRIKSETAKDKRWRCRACAAKHSRKRASKIKP